ncbi:O-succinylhomoserine sulfhydrylase [Reyranella sp.]|jgi:O-succinylhomoserine sulfhydrylase|uniref:O-succinylhomoserine sulfhydrylase n=1 Tax=Reyranella sp. TaxID=1929291 RepID=UPI000BC48B28|nr:O-succinylhomoserine sulfhydrylase [Reyranella sp.]OYY38787.1 MAG: O-succinylhomoserine sulfhydrylase [Rhodospirillales bacterium 35-66-84]OYZ92183.1 MAG: O-succinylhomoserine sulfhydrylase [Rhodospirillales bacterium 24-66-33]OZB23587.1 MAG: O-succinylhomoserine sulfhydrylase [Rhodospirillales bacterium 39-66-50]HQS15364.1 O-succinylhomoserine sulfhydrylase [Reyranella sp.]HQT11890.1 O-succinylhomoserine sulfhydrylase [Reyranella sp.]
MDGSIPVKKAQADVSKWRTQTRAVRGGQIRSNFDETSEALFLTSGYAYSSAEEAEATFKGESNHYQYSRFGNPTVTMFENRLAALEGAEACRATSTGMSAVFFALLALLKSGDRIVAARQLFGSCHYIVTDLLPKYGIESELVDGGDLAQWEKALSQPTQAVLFESPSNPMLDIVDVKAVCDLAHKAGAKVVLDNAFATPILQRPLEFGADVVVHSATKYIDGQGRTLGGAVLGSKEFIIDKLQPIIRNTGPSLSPFNAWVLVKGLETLGLRVERHCTNARRVADALAAHPAIGRVLYPGRPDHPQHALAAKQMSDFGGVVTFDVKAGKPAAFAALNRLQIVDISNNLGDAKSLITHPATTTHMRIGAEERAKLGITDGTIRLSVGLEDVEDIVADLMQALDA